MMESADKNGVPLDDAVTVMEVVPKTVPIEAVIVAVPVPIAVRSPDEVTVAIVLSELCHAAWEETFCVLPSE